MRPACRNGAEEKTRSRAGGSMTATECGACPARGIVARPLVGAGKPIRTPNKREGGETGPARDVVLTSVGHGSFLIHRRKAPPANQCPLLGYDVRRLAADGRPNLAQGLIRTGRSTGRRAPRAACRELLMLFRAGLI